MPRNTRSSATALIFDNDGLERAERAKRNSDRRIMLENAELAHFQLTTEMAKFETTLKATVEEALESASGVPEELREKLKTLLALHQDALRGGCASSRRPTPRRTATRERAAGQDRLDGRGERAHGRGDAGPGRGRDDARRQAVEAAVEKQRAATAAELAELRAAHDAKQRALDEAEERLEAAATPERTPPPRAKATRVLKRDSSRSTARRSGSSGSSSASGRVSSWRRRRRPS